MMQYPYWVENWESPKKEALEAKRNRQITESLRGKRSPKFEEIVNQLKRNNGGNYEPWQEYFFKVESDN